MQIMVVFCPDCRRQPEAHCLQNSEVFFQILEFFGKYLKFLLIIPEIVWIILSFVEKFRKNWLKILGNSSK